MKFKTVFRWRRTASASRISPFTRSASIRRFNRDEMPGLRRLLRLLQQPPGEQIQERNQDPGESSTAGEKVGESASSSSSLTTESPNDPILGLQNSVQVSDTDRSSLNDQQYRLHRSPPELYNLVILVPKAGSQNWGRTSEAKGQAQDCAPEAVTENDDKKSGSVKVPSAEEEAASSVESCSSSVWQRRRGRTSIDLDDVEIDEGEAGPASGTGSQNGNLESNASDGEDCVAEAENENVEAIDQIEAASLSSSRRRRSRASDLDSIDLEAGVIGDEKLEKTYTEKYMNLMFCSGLSLFMPEGISGGIWDYAPVLCFIQVIAFWIVTIFSLLQSLAFLKHYLLAYVTLGGLERFTNMGFYVMTTCTKIYSAYMFTLQQQKFAKMLKSLNRLRAFARRNCNVKEPKFLTIKLILLATCSLSISILSVVLGVGITDWSPEKVLLFESTRMAESVLIWTPEAFSSNETGLAAVITEYGTNLTRTSAIFGMTSFTMELCNRIQTDAMGDLILMTTVTIQKLIFQLAEDVAEESNDIEPVTMETFEKKDGQWAHYQLLQEAVDSTNDAFDCLLKYMHVNNLFLFVFLVMNAFDGTLAIFTILFFMYNIIKTSITYRIATSAAEKNETFRDWIRRLIWKSCDKKFITKAYVILDKLREHPLGLGKGQFMIDESFLFRFLGTAGSVFVLQAQSRESGA